MKHTLTLLTALLLASQSVAGADDGLVMYPPVPGLAASEHYKVRVLTAGGPRAEILHASHQLHRSAIPRTKLTGSSELVIFRIEGTVCQGAFANGF